MEKFNINKVLKKYNPDMDKLAPILFPNVKHPKISLERIVKGEGALSIDQVIILAQYLQVSVGDLLQTEYKVDCSEKKMKIIRNDCVATFDCSQSESCVMSVYREGELIGEYVLGGVIVSLDEILNKIDEANEKK